MTLSKLRKQQKLQTAIKQIPQHKSNTSVALAFKAAVKS